MRRLNGKAVYSATDLVNFLECEHLTALDLVNLDTPLDRREEDDLTRLIQQRGMQHEAAYLDTLRGTGRSVVDVSDGDGSLDCRVAQTRDALTAGPDVIYQAALRDGPLAGYADFLERVDQHSRLGGHSYEVVDTKLARSPKTGHIIQLAFYSSILGQWQGHMPEFMHVVLGDKSRVTYQVAHYMHYYNQLLARFMDAQQRDVDDSYPIPCSKCSECRWIDHCNAVWDRDDHLSRVANIRQSQIDKLTAAGINRLESLARLPEHSDVPALASSTLDTLRHQARLQWQARVTGERIVDTLPIIPGDGRGMQRLPPPNKADLYFDMEGDPLQDGGLEYLFGIGQRTAHGFAYMPFWAHGRAEEKLAFESFVDIVTRHLAPHPDAHIYHYAAYEKTALGRLMSLHGTRERQIDDFFRHERLVDLYRVVRESVRTSEPGYSIKDIEHFYRPPRAGDVKDAGASIAVYEHWRQSGDDALLEQIAAYNRDDVESTSGLHQWLLRLRPQELAWRDSASEIARKHARARDAETTEDRLSDLRDKLFALGTTAGIDGEVSTLAAQLVDFHRREQKPQWWKVFECLQMDAQELIDDVECLGGMVRQPGKPERDKRSLIYTYDYPAQETKLRTGANVTRTDTGKTLTLFDLDEGNGKVRLRVGANRDPLPEFLGLGPGQPINDHALRERVEGFAQSVLAEDRQYLALKRLLARDLPSIAGVEPGAEIVKAGARTDAVIKAVAGMRETYLVIQGPPGTGKTYTASHVIATLIQTGRSVAVAANSHKAIHNLLGAVVDVAHSRKITFRGFKKSSWSDPETCFDEAEFDSSDDLADFNPERHQLFAGTAWAFAKLPAEQRFDYLFIDEASQVSLANLVVMGCNARNIVLLGDQMQLGQPIQGVHPGHSGDSILDYLLHGRPTIPPHEGVFLPRTWRMHPRICEFVSHAFYDGRLHSALTAKKRQIVLTPRAHPVLVPAGIRFVPVMHAGCSQSSEDEAVVVADLYNNLLKQQFDAGQGATRKLNKGDILVLSPYNLQVNLLIRTLPPGARVGTVDKFQGQEAAAVIFSMATSSGDELPRDIEFLYSRNRLNVAISRAQCLAVVVASPELLTVRCRTPGQIKLVNTLCWLKEYAEVSGNTRIDPTASVRSPMPD